MSTPLFLISSNPPTSGPLAGHSQLISSSPGVAWGALAAPGLLAGPLAGPLAIVLAGKAAAGWPTGCWAPGGASGAAGLSEAAARQRVQRLIDTGVIQVVAVTNPLMVGRKRVAMIGIRATGATSELAQLLKNLDIIEYLVVTAGSYDFLAEVVVRDEGELLEATNAIRATPGVTSTETFVYLELVKQTFTWGVH